MVHVSSESLAAYLSHEGTAAERADIEAHLLACDVCREELVAAQRVLARHRRSRRMAGAVAVLGAAAALVVLMRPASMEPPALGPRSDLRAGAAGALLATFAPGPGDTLGAGAITFAWSPAGPERLYHVHVLTEAGEVVWELKTADTVAVVPSTRFSRRPATYLWYVDALGADGESRSSGPVRFTLE